MSAQPGRSVLTDNAVIAKTITGWDSNGAKRSAGSRPCCAAWTHRDPSQTMPKAVATNAAPTAVRALPNRIATELSLNTVEESMAFTAGYLWRSSYRVRASDQTCAQTQHLESSAASISACYRQQAAGPFPVCQSDGPSQPGVQVINVRWRRACWRLCCACCWQAHSSWICRAISFRTGRVTG